MINLISNRISFSFRLPPHLLIYFLIMLFASIGYAQQNPPYNAQKAYDEGRYEDAIVILNNYIKSNTRNLNAYKYLVNSYVAVKKNREAISAAKSALKIFLDEPEVLLSLGKLYGLENQYGNSAETFEKYLSIKPGDREIKELIGKLSQNQAIEYYNQKNYPKAADWFQKALSYDNNDADLMNNVVSLLIYLKRYKEATTRIEQAIKLFPNHGKFREMYSDLLIEQKEYPKAVKYLEELCAKHSNDLSYNLKLALAYRYNNEAEKAIELYAKLRKIHPKEKDIYKAEIDYWNLYDKQDKIRELYQSLQKEFPEEKELSTKIALTFEKEKKFEEARIYLNSCFTKDSSNYDFLIQIAKIFVQEDKIDSATTQLTEIISLDEKNEEAYALLSNLYLKNANYKPALVTNKLFYNNFPTNYNSSFQLGLTYLSLGEKDSAQHYFEISKNVNSSYALTYLELAKIYKDAGETPLAIEMYKKSINRCLGRFSTLETEISSKVSDAGGNYQLDNFSEAEPLTNEFESLKEIFDESFTFLEDQLSREEYIRFLDRELLDYPTNVLLLFVKARYYEKKNDYIAALVYCKRAIQLNSSLKDAHQLMAIIYEKQKNIDEAIRSLKRVIGLDNKNKSAYDEIIRLAQKHNKLNAICDEWLHKYSVTPNDFLKERLLEALHKAGRMEEARTIAMKVSE